MSLSWLAILISILSMVISAYNCYKSYDFAKNWKALFNREEVKND